MHAFCRKQLHCTTIGHKALNQSFHFETKHDWCVKAAVVQFVTCFRTGLGVEPRSKQLCFSDRSALELCILMRRMNARCTYKAHSRRGQYNSASTIRGLRRHRKQPRYSRDDPRCNNCCYSNSAHGKQLQNSVGTRLSGLPQV